MIGRRRKRCPACGYDRTGLGGRRCPECGAPPPGRIEQGSSLDHHDRPTIIRVIRGQAIAFLSQLVVGFAVVSMAVGLGPFGLWMILGGLGVVVNILSRTAGSMRPPEWPRRPMESVVRVVGPLVAGIAAGLAPVVVAFGPVPPGVELLFGLPVVAVAVTSGIFATHPAEWARDDLVLGLLDIAWSLVGLVVLAATLLGLAAAVFTLMSPPAGVLSVGGLVSFAILALRIGAMGWWFIQSVADGKLAVSALLCLWHRSEHDAVDARRLDREQAWNRELASRLDDPGPGEA